LESYDPCPKCKSADVSLKEEYYNYRRYKCNACSIYYAVTTHSENKKEIIVFDKVITTDDDREPEYVLRYDRQIKQLGLYMEFANQCGLDVKKGTIYLVSKDEPK
jgi:hypothetical protein